MDDRIEVDLFGEIDEAAFDTVEAGDREVFLCRIGGDLYAVDNLCTHGGAWLSMGQLSPGTYEVVCPLHGGAFDVRTGQPTRSPCERALRSYQVEQNDGRTYLTEINWFA